MLKVGIVGCGTIGSYLAKSIKRQYKNKIRLIGICDIDKKKIDSLRRSLKTKIPSYSLDSLINRCDLVIEAAAGKISASIVKKAIARKTDVMVMSVGGLLGHLSLIQKARKKIRLYIPSGAIAGLDALKAARMGKISSVTLTTRKPLAGLRGADYIEKKKIDLDRIKKEKVIFKGTAQAAVSGFPKNINVAAILSLIGIGAKKTRVCIIASAVTERNTHTIEIEGDFGKIICCTENVPSALNPKTSQLAVLSAIATLDGILDNARIGT